MVAAYRTYYADEYTEAVRVRLGYAHLGLDVRKPSEVALSEIELGWLVSFDMDTESNEYSTPQERMHEIRERAQSARVLASMRAAGLSEVMAS